MPQENVDTQQNGNNGGFKPTHTARSQLGKQYVFHTSTHSLLEKNEDTKSSVTCMLRLPVFPQHFEICGDALSS